MKEFHLLVLSLCGLCLLAGCGSGAPPPPPISVALTPNSAQALDANQSDTLTASVTNDSSNQGVNWTVTCPSGANTCGAMAQAKSASGVANQYVAPPNVSVTETVKVTATSVSDSTKSATIQVTVNPALTLVNLPPVQQQVATAGTPFSLNLMNFVQGGTAPFTWSITSGTLPSGLTLHATTGMISGTPSTPAAAANVFTLSCTDSGTPPTPLSGTLELSLTINAPGTLAITSGAPPNGAVGSPYGGTHSISGHSFTGSPLTATGGTPSYTWSWTAAQGSSLPPGLSPTLLYISGGSTRCCVYVLAIAGTPTTAGTYNVIVTVTDSASPPAHVNASYTINITSATLAITSGPPPNGIVGATYNVRFVKVCDNPFCTQFHFVPRPGFPLTATGGVPPYTWSWTTAHGSSLPPGLLISLITSSVCGPVSPQICGKPQTVGAYDVVVTVKDSATPQGTASTAYRIDISNPPPPAIDTTPPPSAGAVNLPYSFTFTASNGLAPLDWGETGGLPPGLVWSSAGVLSGTPTGTGSFPITVMVQDSVGQSATPQDFTIQIFAHGFKATGSMGTARVGAAATLLKDGRVLVAGGWLATAELFDPATGTFAPTGSMQMARTTATLLNDGKVLVTGGLDVNGNALTTAELYDPANGTFAPTGSMQAGHEAATLLSNGKVLMTGGKDVNGFFLAMAELYDPGTGSFAPTGSMGTARGGFSTTLLKDGRVLVAGGFDDSLNNLATAELFDPVRGSFVPTGRMVNAREVHSATLLSTGKVLVTGGLDSNARTFVAAELFDPASGSFSPTGSMQSAHYSHSATLLNDGRVLVTGGADSSNHATATAELFDLSTGTFTLTGSMTTARESHGATLLNDGRVLVTGGFDGFSTLATAELYQ